MIMNESEQGSHLLEGRTRTYPPIQAFFYMVRFSVTFIGVKWTPLDKPTQNLGFPIPFHLYILDHESQ